MADGLGQALGAGAGAFSGAFQSTLNYKLALAQQQMQAGAQAERVRLAQERQQFEREKFEFDRNAINETNRINREQNKFDRAVNEQERKESERKRSLTKEGVAESLAEARVPKPSGAQITQQVAQGKAVDTTQLGTPEFLARKEEQFKLLATPKTRTTPTTANERFIAKLLDENTSDEERALIEKFTSKGIPDVVWGNQNANDKLDIVKEYNNIAIFGGALFREKYPNAEAWFNEAILGEQPIDAGGAEGEPIFSTAKDIEEWVKDHPEDEILLTTPWYLKQKKKK